MVSDLQYSADVIFLAAHTAGMALLARLGVVVDSYQTPSYAPFCSGTFGDRDEAAATFER
jgi:hypothetical protein